MFVKNNISRPEPFSGRNILNSDEAPILSHSERIRPNCSKAKKIKNEKSNKKKKERKGKDTRGHSSSFRKAHHKIARRFFKVSKE